MALLTRWLRPENPNRTVGTPPAVKAVSPPQATGHGLIKEAHASSDAGSGGACPTIQSAPGHGCSVTTNSIQLDYVGCLTQGGGRWTGGERWVVNGGHAACGSGPEASFTGSITQIFMPGTRHEKSGHTLEFDPGRGMTVILVGGKKHQAEINAVRLKSEKLELTLETPTLLALQEQGSGLLVDGEIRAFDHRAGKALWLKVKGLKLDPGCDRPIGGTIEAATQPRGAPVLKTSFGPDCQKISAQAIL